jgi:hypothetical protein
MTDDAEMEYPPQYRTTYRRALAGKSPRDAIRAFCLACVGYNPYEVKDCSCDRCPLYPYRLRGGRNPPKNPRASPYHRVDGPSEVPP